MKTNFFNRPRSTFTERMQRQMSRDYSEVPGDYADAVEDFKDAVRDAMRATEKMRERRRQD